MSNIEVLIDRTINIIKAPSLLISCHLDNVTFTVPCCLVGCTGAWDGPANFILENFPASPTYNQWTKTLWIPGRKYHEFQHDQYKVISYVPGTKINPSDDSFIYVLAESETKVCLDKGIKEIEIKPANIVSNAIVTLFLSPKQRVTVRVKGIDNSIVEIKGDDSLVTLYQQSTGTTTRLFDLQLFGEVNRSNVLIDGSTLHDMTFNQCSNVSISNSTLKENRGNLQFIKANVVTFQSFLMVNSSIRFKKVSKCFVHDSIIRTNQSHFYLDKTDIRIRDSIIWSCNFKGIGGDIMVENTHLGNRLNVDYFMTSKLERITFEPNVKGVEGLERSYNTFTFDALGKVLSRQVERPVLNDRMLFIDSLTDTKKWYFDAIDLTISCEKSPSCYKYCFQHGTIETTSALQISINGVIHLLNGNKQCAGQNMVMFFAQHPDIPFLYLDRDTRWIPSCSIWFRVSDTIQCSNDGNIFVTNLHTVSGPVGESILASNDKTLVYCNPDVEFSFTETCNGFDTKVTSTFEYVKKSKVFIISGNVLEWKILSGSGHWKDRSSRSKRLPLDYFIRPKEKDKSPIMESNHSSTNNKCCE